MNSCIARWVVAVAACATLPLVPAQTPPPTEVPLRWRAATPVPVGPMAGLPEVADLDGDGDLDVVVACGPCCGMDPSPEAGHVRVLLGDGAGGLQPLERIPVGETALRVTVGDVDRDGALDIACIQHSSHEATVLFGDGEGGFTERPPLRFALHDHGEPHVHSVALADVNHDGHPDLIASLVNAHAIAVHLGDGRGGFTPALGQPYFAHQHPYEQISLADLNGDDHPDIVCTDVRGHGVTVLLGSGTGMFAASKGFRMEAHTPLGNAERPCALALGDLDGDGAPDIVANIDESPQVAVLFNRGDGVFEPAAHSPIEVALPTHSIRLADLDGDGRLDLLTGSAAGEGIAVSRGQGDGTFGPSIAVGSTGRVASVATGDFDGDGRLDLVASSYGDGTVTLLLRQ